MRVAGVQTLNADVNEDGDRGAVIQPKPMVMHDDGQICAWFPGSAFIEDGAICTCGWFQNLRIGRRYHRRRP